MSKGEHIVTEFLVYSFLRQHLTQPRCQPHETNKDDLELMTLLLHLSNAEITVSKLPIGCVGSVGVWRVREDQPLGLNTCGELGELGVAKS